MTEPAKTCDRCGEPLEQDPIVVSVASGPPHPIPSTIHLCEHCADSMALWMLRKQRSRGRRSSPQRRDRGRASRRRSHLERRTAMILGAILVVLAGGVTVWVLVHLVHEP
jgi:hypothetical protein